MRLIDRTNKEIFENQELLTTAVVEFLGDLINPGREDEAKLQKLCQLLGDPVKVLKEGDPKIRELILNIFYTAKAVQGKPVVREGEKRHIRVIVDDHVARTLRQRQFDINKTLANLLGYKGTSEMKVFFSFNFFAKSINDKK